MSASKLTPATYTVDIAGQPTELPIVAINDTLAISLLMVIDMGVGFGERTGKALAARLAERKPDIVVGAATLGIPVAIEVSRHLGLDQYVIVQKSPKIHLGDALVECGNPGAHGERIASQRRLGENIERLKPARHPSPVPRATPLACGRAR